MNHRLFHVLILRSLGDDLDVYVVNPLSVRPLQRSIPSSAWLMPYQGFWKPDEVIGYGPIRNYTVSNYDKLFEDINFPDGYMMRKDTEGLGLKELKAPGVEVHCLHGTAVKTPETFHWTEKQFPDSSPSTDYGPGDGTVNLRSLHGCLLWRGKQKQKVLHQEFAGVGHLGILKSPDAIAYLKSIVHGA